MICNTAEFITEHLKHTRQVICSVLSHNLVWVLTTTLVEFYDRLGASAYQVWEALTNFVDYFAQKLG